MRPAPDVGRQRLGDRSVGGEAGTGLIGSVAAVVVFLAVPFLEAMRLFSSA